MALKSDQTVTSVSERIEQLNNIDKVGLLGALILAC